jgi:hypothetical protein
MTFELFGPAKREDIRVAYISPDQGLVENVSICDANAYAKLNPGTVFIFKRRDKIKYLNINGVNALTPDELVPEEEECPGVTGLDVYNADGTVKEQKKETPTANFYGGGGFGAMGNPIFGDDGSLLAVDLINGGYGYKYPPIVRVTDEDGVGAGAVTRSILCEQVETEIVYDQLEDFEEYHICEDDTINFGRRLSFTGEDLGDWDPTLYATFEPNPIRREIKEYQETLSQLTNPFWTTTKTAPLKVTSPNKTTRLVYQVENAQLNQKGFPFWNDFLNFNGISPVPRSNVRPSDFAGIPFTMEWEINFPFDGEYVFRGCCDNSGALYVNNKQIATYEAGSGGAAGDTLSPPIKTKKKMTAGNHRIRLDLLNFPIKTKVRTGQGSPPVASGGKQIVFGNLHPANSSIRVTNNGKKIELKDGDGNDSNAALIIESGNLTFSPDGKSLVGTGDATIRMGWSDNPNTAGVAVDTITIQDKTWTRVGRSGNETHNITIAPPVAPVSEPSTSSDAIQKRLVFDTIKGINSANRPLWRINPTAGRDAGFLSQYGVLPFDPTTTTDEYAGTHEIIWNNINFPVDGNYTIEMMVDDSVVLYFKRRNDEEIVFKKNGFTPTGRSTGKSFETRFFESGNYSLRAELKQESFRSTLADGNVMALGIKIETTFTETEVISLLSWEENPMAIALTIDAPEPPVPQEPIPVAEGRCPNNPIWSTRFPGGKERWYPVHLDDQNWSPFMNRYAMSPVQPLSEENSDGGRSGYRNTWTVDVPYDGFYGLKGTADNTGKVLVDGKEIAILQNYSQTNPKTTKFFLAKGSHVVDVEIQNEDTTTYTTIDKKIFSTKDWATPASIIVDSASIGEQEIVYSGLNAANNPIRVTNNNKRIELKDGGGSDTNAALVIESGDLTFSDDGKYIKGRGSATVRMGWSDNPGTQGVAIDKIRIGQNVWTRVGRSGNETHVIEIDMKTIAKGLESGTEKAGAKYLGPTEIASYAPDTLSPIIPNIGLKDAQGNWIPDPYIQGRTWIFKWEVDFPVTGTYDISSIADDIVTVRIDDIEVIKYNNYEDSGTKLGTFFANEGKKIVELELYNRSFPGTAFNTNPVTTIVTVTKKTKIEATDSAGTVLTKPWTENPIAISAELIPPPCPKIVKGQGVVCRVVVDDAGNGFPRPQGDPDRSTTGGYPVALKLDDVIVEDSGINYNCGVDQIVIEPSNGAKISYECDTFGRISKVNVDDGGLGFNKVPDIRMVTDTGINATFRPQFAVERDPVAAVLAGELSQDGGLLQVTDLVGLKQTGYYDGRPYYGAVFYKDGIRYAGYYETTGQLVQIYDTMQESITAEVTTLPSAIRRQGTDISSNDSRLNIPGTPDTLT